MLLFVLLVGGCEETVDITDATYRERLVVYGVLDANDTVDIVFTRTLPINRPYSAADAAVPDVAGRITAINPDDPSLGNFADLVHVGGGHYKAGGMRIHPGWTYRLEATWRGGTIRSSTVVPHMADVDSVMLVPSTWYWEGQPTEMFSVRAVIDPRPDEVYLLTTGIYDGPGGKPSVRRPYGANVVRPRDTTEGGRIALVDDWNSQSKQARVAAVVVAYDEPYYDFQRTYYHDDDMGPFGSGSDNVKWTVEGDGIGLFIGRSTTIVPVP